jgi:hypothetical protein
MNDGWKVVVRLFGRWTSEAAGGFSSKRWLEVASAAAFGVVGLQWARKLQHAGEAQLSQDMLLAVEAAGVGVGLAGSHEIMQQVGPLRCPIVMSATCMRVSNALRSREPYWFNVCNSS